MLKSMEKEQTKNNNGQHLQDQQLVELVDEIRGYRDRIDHLREKMNEARDQVETLLIERGGSWKDDEGYAVLVSEGECTSYDANALDELLLNDPLRYGWLKDYRRKSVVSGSVKVK
ncbi:hypothetical protein G4Y79_06620 [Phototrophicus methaneseepsis]|uniref:Phage protein n=1 Tax=Phototrophicus methaneseepsis TaxID=2710758 RepID=A0A7S8EBT9_9CHLR|nr:hypothetical protein [Phototrophicus methaneseepsis]QPC84047.1 hypothetical protein G4Y79_06620 [Phototrophicus methaneseepsis]